MGISSPWCDACVRVAAAREREGEAVGGGGGGTRGRDREEGVRARLARGLLGLGPWRWLGCGWA